MEADESGKRKKGKLLGSGTYGNVYDIEGRDDVVRKVFKSCKDAILSKSTTVEMAATMHLKEIKAVPTWYYMQFHGDEVFMDMYRFERDLGVYGLRSMEEFFHVARQLLSMLVMWSRKKIVHSDLKPNNVVIKRFQIDEEIQREAEFYKRRELAQLLKFTDGDEEREMLFDFIRSSSEKERDYGHTAVRVIDWGMSWNVNYIEEDHERKIECEGMSRSTRPFIEPNSFFREKVTELTVDEIMKADVWNMGLTILHGLHMTRERLGIPSKEPILYDYTGFDIKSKLETGLRIDSSSLKQEVNVSDAFTAEEKEGELGSLLNLLDSMLKVRYEDRVSAEEISHYPFLWTVTRGHLHYLERHNAFVSKLEAVPNVLWSDLFPSPSYREFERSILRMARDQDWEERTTFAALCYFNYCVSSGIKASRSTSSFCSYLAEHLFEYAQVSSTEVPEGMFIGSEARIALVIKSPRGPMKLFEDNCLSNIAKRHVMNEDRKTFPQFTSVARCAAKMAAFIVYFDCGLSFKQRAEVVGDVGMVMYYTLIIKHANEGNAKWARIKLGKLKQTKFPKLSIEERIGYLIRVFFRDFVPGTLPKFLHDEMYTKIRTAFETKEILSIADTL